MNKFTKKIMLLLGCVISFCASAQNLVSPISINLPANPPANTAEWATTLPPVMILAQTKPVNGVINGYVQDSRILVTIKSGGSKVCGTYTPQTAPMSGFNSPSKNWKGTDVISLLGQECTLKPGSYELCVQFYTMDAAVRIIGETCKPFTIADKKEKETYTPPQNIFPNNNKVFSEKETKLPIIFRWTPIIPKPKASVTYKLRVWEMQEGQSATQAIKMNTALLEKDVKEITQSVEKITFPPCTFNGSCGNKFTWNVQASKQNQMGEVEMLGASEPTSFSVANNDIDTQIDSLKIGCCENGKQTIRIKIKNNLANANTSVKKVLIMGVNGYTGTPYPLDISASLTPALPYNFLPSNGTKVFTGTIDCIANMNTVIIKSESERIVSGIPLVEPDLAYDTLNCRCNLCDTNIVKWTLPTQISYSANQTNNIASLSGPISFGPYPIVKLSTEIVDFYWYTEGDCKKCNTNDYYFGNLVGGSLTGMVGGTSVAGPLGTPIPSSHQLDFISSTLSGVSLSNNINLNISLPPQTQLSCCTDCFRFCIRYTATFMQNGVCKTCSIVKCYETKRKHKQTEWQLQLNDCGERIIIKGDLDNTQIK
jgi:hypothetical protein